MATLMLENGADIRHIQEMLGHRNLETTEVYTQVSLRKLKAIHAATHPAAKRDSGKTTVSDGHENVTATNGAERSELGDEKKPCTPDDGD